MGGGDGVIISRDAAVAILSNPIVLGNLPVTLRSALEPILKKDPSTWTDAEREIVVKALDRAMRGKQP